MNYMSNNKSNFNIKIFLSLIIMIYFNETHIYLGFIWCVAIGLKNKTAFLKKPIIYNGEGLLA